MAEQFYTIPTAIGKAKIANSITIGTKINLTTMKIGDSNGSYYNPTESQTDLVHAVYSCNVTSVEIDENNSNWINVICAIPADIGDFYIREAGIFDDSGNLIAIGKYPETYKPVASNGSTKELYIKMTFEVTNASNVELKIDPTVILATKSDISILTNSISSINAQLSERVKQTTADITYYVDGASGNDSNNGLTNGTAFKTITKAISMIPNIVNHNITINVSVGTYNEIVTIQGKVVNGQINLNGATSLSSVNSFSILAIYVRNCIGIVNITGFTSIGTHSQVASGFWAYSSIGTVFSYCSDLVSDAMKTAITSLFSSITIANSQFSNKDVAISSQYNSKVFSNNNSGSSNNLGLQAMYDGAIGIYGTQPSGATSQAVNGGGVIRS